jgi:hypothetical protein
VYDTRSESARPQTPDHVLENFDESDEANPIHAYFGDRGFFVFDETISLVDAVYHYVKKATEQSCGACDVEIVIWYLIERACFSLISAPRRSPTTFWGSCCRFTAVATISSYAPRMP